MAQEGGRAGAVPLHKGRVWEEGIWESNRRGCRAWLT